MINRESLEERPGTRSSHNSWEQRMSEKYFTEVSEKFEEKLSQKISQEVSKTMNIILRALSKLYEFVTNPEV